MPGTTHRPQPSCFNTTHWSLVLAANGDSSGAQAALEELCRTYWYPLYAFARRSGHKPHDAEDLIQSFFALALRKNFWGTADQSKGRFRTFLLVALKRFLVNDWTRARARKRGGGQALISLEALSAEQRYAIEPAGQLTPDKLFERRWALTVLERVLARLQEEQRAAGKLAHFNELKETLAGPGGTSYGAIGTRLGMSEGAVKVAVHRLRQRYRQLLNLEIAGTVATAEEIEEERRHLFEALSG